LERCGVASRLPLSWPRVGPERKTFAHGIEEEIRPTRIRIANNFGIRKHALKAVWTKNGHVIQVVGPAAPSGGSPDGKGWQPVPPAPGWSDTH
jgi:hypothetical protein